MRENSYSRTAVGTAFLRAAHMRIDDSPPVLNDPVAERLLPALQRGALSRMARSSLPSLRQLRGPRDPFHAMRAHIVSRARYAEDALTGDAGRYVILAAGLDTFAYRQTEPYIDVTEIDHPASQRWKRERLQKKSVRAQKKPEYIPIDFEEQSLDSVWSERTSPDVVSWLGATYYLTQPAIEETLRVIARRTTAGSQIIFDFWSRPGLLNPSAPLLAGTRLSVALQREPMKTFLTEKDVEALSANTGWRLAETLSPQDQNERYFSNRRDRLQVPDFAWLARFENPGQPGH